MRASRCSIATWSSSSRATTRRPPSRACSPTSRAAPRAARSTRACALWWPQRTEPLILPPVDLDLLVIGSGPGGQRAAVQAAKLGKRVAVVERRGRVGGVSIHTGTIPSKTLRQAILEDLARRPYEQIDALRPREQERQAARFLMDRTAQVVADETALIREQ